MKLMTYIVDGPKRRIVVIMPGPPIAEFTDAASGRAAWGHFVTGFAAAAGGSIYDCDAGQYLVGAVEQLDAQT